MVVTEDLQQHTGDILAVYVELDKLARQYFKCLCQPHTVKQPEGMAKLSDFLNKSEHKGAVWPGGRFPLPTRLNTLWKKRMRSTAWIMLFLRRTQSIC